MDITSLKQDAVAVEGGEWVENLPDAGDFAVFTRALTCNAARAYYTRLLAQIMGRRRGKYADTPPEVTAYVNARVLIDVCISDWRNAVLPVDAAGAVAIGDAAAEKRPVPFSRAALAAVILEDAPDGVIVTSPPPGQPRQKFATPDRKQVRAAMQPFLDVLFVAAGGVGAVDEDDGQDTEKNG